MIKNWLKNWQKKIGVTARATFVPQEIDHLLYLLARWQCGTGDPIEKARQVTAVIKIDGEDHDLEGKQTG